MSDRVKVAANIEFTHSDVERLQDYRIDQVDKLVLDAIHTGKVFAGFPINQSSAARIIIGAGRLYVAGKDYSRPADTATSFDFATGGLTLPVSQFKYFSLVGYGSEREIDTQPREFETAVKNTEGNYTGEYEVDQRDVATTIRRYANLDMVPGIESANPQPPNIDSASSIEIARILCSPTAIVSITYVEANRLETIENLTRRMGLSELFAAALRTAVDTIISDFGSLRALVDQLPRGATIDQLVRDMSRVKEELGRPDTATVYGSSTFGTANELDLTHAQSMCRVDGVLTFAAASIKEVPLTFQNPNEPAVKKEGNITLPAFNHVLAIDTTAGLTLA